MSYNAASQKKYRQSKKGKATDRRYQQSDKHQVVQRRYRLKRHGISPDEYGNLLKSQNYGCAICGTRGEQLDVDHDHETGRVRGLLCRICNLAIGLLKDRPEVAQFAADYLRQGQD